MTEGTPVPLPPHHCPDMLAALADADVPIVYNDKFREYGLRILDGGSAVLLIRHCPWCGKELPSSLRDEWFDELERRGLRPDDPDIPEDLRSGAWWRDDA
jgi:hypothetical protein